MDFMCLSNTGIYEAFTPLFSHSRNTHAIEAQNEAIKGTFDYDYRLFTVIRETYVFRTAQDALQAAAAN